MKTKHEDSQRMLYGMALVLSLSLGLAHGQIAAVNPDSATQGTTGLTVTITLDADANPPIPPMEAAVTNMMIGMLSGTSVSRVSETVVIAVFDIPANEGTGTRDVSITFTGPPQGGQGPTFTATGSFTITAMTNTAPSITTQPKSQAVRLGKSTTFTVGVYGSEPMTYQWQKDNMDIADANSAFGMEWQDALAYAESLTLADHNDWRLPNIKELQSIVDYTKSPSASDSTDLGPAIDTNFFNITEMTEGTTAYSPDYDYVWSSTSAYFGGDSREYYYAWYVAFGTAVNGEGKDFHGAGGVRFDTKSADGPVGEGGERYYNFVRYVRDVK
ncbi:DUF1566 domain-containing protein [Planctomycetota bacterium]